MRNNRTVQVPEDVAALRDRARDLLLFREPGLSDAARECCRGVLMTDWSTAAADEVAWLRARTADVLAPRAPEAQAAEAEPAEMELEAAL